MTYSPETRITSLEEKVEDLEEAEEKEHSNDSEVKVDIAGLMALMQNNKGMDLPGILALTKEKGFGGDGIGLLVILLFFLMFNGGTFGNGINRTAAQETAAAAGLDLQVVTGMYDRIATLQASTQQGFSTIQTNLCSSIAEVIGSVRNQGDRVYDSTRQLSTQMSDCCCTVNTAIARLECQVNGVERSISEQSQILGGKIELSQERTANAMQAMESRLLLQAERNQRETDSQFCALNNKLDKSRLEEENMRLREALHGCRDQNLANTTAQTVINSMQQFAVNHYTPTAK